MNTYSNVVDNEVFDNVKGFILSFTKTWMFLGVCLLVYVIPIGMEITNLDPILTLIAVAVSAECCKRYCLGEVNEINWWVLNGFIWISEFMLMVVFTMISSVYALQFVGAELDISEIMGIAILAHLIPLGFNLATLHFHAKRSLLIYLVLANIIFNGVWNNFVIQIIQSWIMG